VPAARPAGERDGGGGRRRRHYRVVLCLAEAGEAAVTLARLAAERWAMTVAPLTLVRTCCIDTQTDVQTYRRLQYVQRSRLCTYVQSGYTLLVTAAATA